MKKLFAKKNNYLKTIILIKINIILKQHYGQILRLIIILKGFISNILMHMKLMKKLIIMINSLNYSNSDTFIDTYFNKNTYKL